MIRFVLMLIAAILTISLPLFTPAHAADAVQPFVAVRVGGIINEDSNVNDTTSLGLEMKSSGIARTGLKTDTGFAIGGAAGVELRHGRVEFELLWRKNRLDQNEVEYVTVDFKGFRTSHRYGFSGDFTVATCLFNGYLTLPVEGPISPYIAAGVGIARASVDQFDNSEKHERWDVKPAFQVGAGFTLPVNSKVSLDFSYKYLGTPDFDFNGAEISYRSHNFLLGANFFF